MDTGNTDTVAVVPTAQDRLDTDSSGSREQNLQEHTKIDVGPSPTEPGSSRSNPIPKGTVIKIDDSKKTQNNCLATEDECKSSQRELTSQNSDRLATDGLATDAQSVVVELADSAVPLLPCTSIEFQSHWKHVRKDWQQLVTYFNVSCTVRGFWPDCMYAYRCTYTSIHVCMLSSVLDLLFYYCVHITNKTFLEQN